MYAKTISEQEFKEIKEQVIVRWYDIVKESRENKATSLETLVTNVRSCKCHVIKVLKEFDAEVIDSAITGLYKEGYLINVSSHIRLSDTAFEDFLTHLRKHSKIDKESESKLRERRKKICDAPKRTTKRKKSTKKSSDTPSQEINEIKKNSRTFPKKKRDPIQKFADDPKPQLQKATQSIEKSIINNTEKRQSEVHVSHIKLATISSDPKPKKRSINDLLKDEKKLLEKTPITRSVSKLEQSEPKKEIKVKSADEKETRIKTKMDQLTEHHDTLPKDKQEKIVEITRSKLFMELIATAEKVAEKFDGKIYCEDEILVEAKRIMPNFAEVFFKEFFSGSVLPDVMHLELSGWRKRKQT